MVTILGPEAGGVAAVVNRLVKSALSGLPLRSVIPVVAITVMVEDTGKVVVNVAVRLSADNVMLALRFACPAKRSSVVPVTLAGFTDPENVTETAAFCPTPVALFDGVTEVIVKGVTIGGVTGV